MTYISKNKLNLITNNIHKNIFDKLYKVYQKPNINNYIDVNEYDIQNELHESIIYNIKYNSEYDLIKVRFFDFEIAFYIKNYINEITNKKIEYIKFYYFHSLVDNMYSIQNDNEFPLDILIVCNYLILDNLKVYLYKLPKCNFKKLLYDYLNIMENFYNNKNFNIFHSDDYIKIKDELLDSLINYKTILFTNFENFKDNIIENFKKWYFTTEDNVIIIKPCYIELTDEEKNNWLEILKFLYENTRYKPINQIKNTSPSYIFTVNLSNIKIDDTNTIKLYYPVYCYCNVTSQWIYIKKLDKISVTKIIKDMKLVDLVNFTPNIFIEYFLQQIDFLKKLEKFKVNSKKYNNCLKELNIFMNKFIEYKLKNEK